MTDQYTGAPVRLAVIGGTGLDTLPGFTVCTSLTLDTPWGRPSSPISILRHTATDGSPTYIAFLARHGLHHEIAPHEIPGRANIAALRSLGVRTIIAFSAVGSLRGDIKPRDFVVPDQIIDRTKGIRPFTFFEGGVVGHVPFADPFDKALSAVIVGCGSILSGDGVRLHGNGTLICMEGPQFSTRAESHMYRAWGADIINMSVLPEAKLAREAEIAYQMVCMSTDYDCWKEDEDVSIDAIRANMAFNSKNAKDFLASVLDELRKDQHQDLVLARHLEGLSRGAASMTAAEGRSSAAAEKLSWLLPGIFP